MSDREYIKQAASQILSGLVANPNIVVHDSLAGWRLCNCTPAQIVSYTVHLAQQLEFAVHAIEERDINENSLQ